MKKRNEQEKVEKVKKEITSESKKKAISPNLVKPHSVDGLHKRPVPRTKIR